MQRSSVLIGSMLTIYRSASISDQISIIIIIQRVASHKRVRTTILSAKAAVSKYRRTHSLIVTQPNESQETPHLRRIDVLDSLLIPT
jgi:hypothetical protein